MINQMKSERYLTTAELHARRFTAGAVIALGALTLSACAPALEETPVPTQSGSSETPAPVETEAPEVGPSVELTADMTDDELGEGTMQILTDWRNAGANDQLRYDRVEANQDWDTFLPTVVEKNRKIFGDILFPEGWENDPRLVTFADLQAEINLQTLKLFVNSEWNGDEKPENIDGYERYINKNGSAVSPDSIGEALRQIDIPYIESDNSNKNYAPDDLLISTGPIEGTYSVVYEMTDDGLVEITDAQITETH